MITMRDISESKNPASAVDLDKPNDTVDLDKSGSGRGLDVPVPAVDLDGILSQEAGQFGWFQVRALLLAAVLLIFCAWSAGGYVFTTARIHTRCRIPECDGAQTEFSPPWLPAALPRAGAALAECQRYGWSTRSDSRDNDSADINNSTDSKDRTDINDSSIGTDSRDNNSVDINDNTNRGDINSTDIIDSTDSGYSTDITRSSNGTVSRDNTDSKNSCTVKNFNTSHVVPCDAFVYENSNTVVYDFDLGCSEWRRSLLGSVRLLGSLLALPLTGLLSDRLGRRAALAVNAANAAWLGLARRWAADYWGFMAMEFLEATFGSGVISSVYILFAELVGPDYRLVTSAIVVTCWSLGHVTLGLLAWAAPAWRTLILVLYGPQVISVVCVYFMPESIRWLVSKERYEQAETTLKKMAATNGRELSEKTLLAFRMTVEKQNQNPRQEDKEPLLIVQVWRCRPILVRCLIAPVCWVTMTLVYYGLSINAVNMSGSQYLNYVLVSCVEVPGHWSAVLAMGRVGRKPVLIGAYWLCAVCQLAYVLIPSGLYGASLAVYLIGKYCIAVVASSVYVYTAELFPTKHRHSLFAYCSMVGRVGSMVAPLTPAFGALWAPCPFVLFGGMSVLSGALLLLTPETRGAALPDSMQQAARLGAQ